MFFFFLGGAQVVKEEYFEVVQYRYVEKEEVVPIYRYKPVFDVQVDIPPPLLVPVPVEPVRKNKKRKADKLYSLHTDTLNVAYF